MPPSLVSGGRAGGLGDLATPASPGATVLTSVAPL